MLSGPLPAGHSLEGKPNLDESLFNSVPRRSSNRDEKQEDLIDEELAIIASAMNQKDQDDMLPQRRIQPGKGKTYRNERDNKRTSRSKGRRRSHGNSITSGNAVGLSNTKDFKPKEAALVYVKNQSHHTYNQPVLGGVRSVGGGLHIGKRRKTK